MLNKMYIIYLSCALFVLAESAFVDNLGKCTLADQACHTKLYADVIQEAAKGIPELGVKAMDPYKISDPIKLAINGVIDLKVESAVLEGISKCTLDKSVVNMDKKILEYLLNCPEIKFVGGYELGSSPAVNKIIGQDITGKGNAVAIIPNAVVKGNFAFKVEERDGKIYFSQKTEETTTNFEVNGEVKFDVDNIRMGGDDVSPMVNGLLNRNGKLLVSIFSVPVGNILMDIYFTQIRNFITAVPAASFISDDLSKFVD